MSRRDLTGWEDYESDDQTLIEQMSRRSRPILPVSSGRNADRMSKKTHGSKKVKKLVSRKSGGMHRRRQKTVR